MFDGVVSINNIVLGTGTLTNNATLATASSTSVGGNLISGGTLDFDITPNSAGQFNVVGTATLDGSVNVDFLDGEIPAASTTLLTAGSPIVLPSGLPSLSVSGASGLSLALSGDSMSLLLNSVTGLPGDFDGDNDVDGADFLTWQRDLGDATNLGIWQDNYGTGALAAAAGAAAVPEPTSMLMMLLATAPLMAGRRKERK